MKPVAIFGTRDIYTSRPCFPGQRPVCEDFYSTGKLEAAIEQGYDVYVVSIRPVFGKHDRWWQALLPPDRVFVNTGVMSALTGDMSKANVFDAWQRFYRLHGLPWSEAFDDMDDPRTAAVNDHGFIDGSAFQGHVILN